ncbi:MAG: RNA-binding protein [Candidatus Eremiobacteraeota bacterium]|nr:RNA-binding protein [Candidatus Eremiobacteraeota bacterium]
MAKKLYVGNLPYDIEETALRELFSAHGTVESVSIITDRDTGRSKGFGFVEMSNDEEKTAAIAALDGKELSGRSLKVNEARERSDSRPPRRDMGGGGGRRRF